MNDTSGRTCGKQFATYDPDTRSWRTWPAIGLWGSIEYSETWPRMGYMRSGAAFELPMSVPVTDANASLSSPLLPTPSVADGMGGHATRSGSRSDELHLLPTPQSADGNGGGRLGSDGHAMPLPGAVVQLLPTPRTSDTNGPGAHGDGGMDLRTAVTQWGDYESAIRRAELACGRPAPSPTEPNRNGNPRLSARFAEWMMMIPAGHVTDVGLSRNEQLKALGNGVVPAQALAALERLVPIAQQVAS